MKRVLLIVTILVAVVSSSILIYNQDATVKQDNAISIDDYESYYAKKAAKKRAGAVKADRPDLHSQIQRDLRTKLGDDGPKYGPNQVIEEFMKAKKRAASTQARTANSLDFIERGPGNIGGRTRGLIIDPDDPNYETFYAGAASGGIWKTTNAGEDWEYISGDIPNLGTNTLVMAPSNTNVIYAGTGEHFTNDIDGAGMFKSTNKGDTWVQIADPSVYPDFKNVSRIVVDPNDENTVIATTRSTVWGSFAAAIYKTTDGGNSWTRVLSSTSVRYDDIDYDPTNFNTLYVAVQGQGVIKSTDGGETWTDASTGMSPSGRVEITISPVNSNRLWASVQGGLSGSGSDLYVSSDGAQTWNLAVNADGNNEDFLGGQGWYDNIITGHPFDEDIVYVGGVNSWKFEITTAEAQTIKLVDVELNGVDNFMSFINFGGAYLGGGMDTGSVPNEELLPIEIRFGQGSQKAHRFTVGGQGPSVPASQYIYEDYVEVPFQVWDTENNVQLMASFRDQQEDGEWNLIASNTDGATEDDSREYLFVHNIPYSESANSNISVNGGHEVNEMYFYWPVLANGATFDSNNLPVSNIAVVFNELTGRIRETTNVSDAYGGFGGPNGFPQATREAGLHPDQHNFVVYDVDETNQTFRLLVGNDGGVYRTIASPDPGPFEGDFEYISYGYNTTQFYGADKAPGENRYIGGMQDNGTWYNTPGTEGSATTFSTFAIGGDGFESLWHSQDPDKIIGGSQFNNFARTLNGGQSWESATVGFNDSGPFRTRLAHHKQIPEKLYTVGSTGVWSSDNFGGQWSASQMNDPDLWSFSNSADVEVSYANPNVIWAGARLQTSQRLHVSIDGGQTFNAAENYSEFDMGSVSGIGTHPSDDRIAYALFSFAGFPKVIRTSDRGQSWEDISGFDGSGAESSRGFPDVATNCLFVFPDNNNRIWVGTEIGIVESLDGGASWNLMENNMPSVNVFDFKLADDQVVIATYGRGIWSVTIDGVITSPEVKTAYTKPDGTWNVNVTFSTDFDSTEVFVSGNKVGTTYNNIAGDAAISVQNNGSNGLQKISIVSYLSGVAYQSIEKEAFVFSPVEAVDTYSNDFSGIIEDFVGSGLFAARQLGFSNEALHSPHPYQNDKDNAYYFKSPIVVAAEDAVIAYRDIALLEPGVGDATFGDESFNDYVVVEASSDGVNWIALEDGYDASLHPEWLEAYNNGTNANSSLFKSHIIELRDHFTTGDVILVRFRMFSNSSGQAYGWVIDDLLIQLRPLSTASSVSGELSVYPNPVTNSATIVFSGNVTGNIKVYNLEGRMVDEIRVENQNKTVWNKGNLESGIYLFKYETEGKIKSLKVFVD